MKKRLPLQFHGVAAVLPEGVLDQFDQNGRLDLGHRWPSTGVEKASP